MAKFTVVSVDMFGTLVNLDSVAALVWRTFLKDGFTEELGKKHWNRGNELVFEYFDEHVFQKQQYISTMLIFEKCYTELFAEIGLNYDPKEAAYVLAHYHSLSKPYDDALPFLSSVGNTYPICLSSDTDDYMLGDLINMHPFDHIFTSGQLESYKSNSGKRFFSAVIAQYGVGPEKIFHIGDSSLEILAANEAGMVTCWVNRKGRKWAHDIKPDFEVKSLTEAAAILDIDVDSGREQNKDRKSV